MFCFFVCARPRRHLCALLSLPLSLVIWLISRFICFFQRIKRDMWRWENRKADSGGNQERRLSAPDLTDPSGLWVMTEWFRTEKWHFFIFQRNKTPPAWIGSTISPRFIRLECRTLITLIKNIAAGRNSVALADYRKDHDESVATKKPCSDTETDS